VLANIWCLSDENPKKKYIYSGISQKEKERKKEKNHHAIWPNAMWNAERHQEKPSVLQLTTV
jgi:hypothetical protein